MGTEVTRHQFETTGAEAVVNTWKAIGDAARASLRQQREEAEKVPPALKAIDTAAHGLKDNLADLGNSFGLVGRSLLAFAPSGPAGVAAGAIVGLGVGFIALAKNAADTAATLEHQAIRVGVSVEKLQVYQYVAKLTGVEQGALNTALERFVKNSGQAEQGTGTLATGIGKVDSALLKTIQSSASTSKGFEAVIARIAELPTVAERAAVAVAAFARLVRRTLPRIGRRGEGGRRRHRP